MHQIKLTKKEIIGTVFIYIILLASVMSFILLINQLNIGKKDTSIQELKKELKEHKTIIEIRDIREDTRNKEK